MTNIYNSKIMEQLRFLDKFLHYYGIFGLSDHKSMIASNSITDNNIQLINASVGEIKQHFQISKMNLSRKNYHIDSQQLALSVLKNCLHQANIPYEIVKKKDANYLRLIPPNKLYMEYIENPMDNIHHQTIDYNTFRETLRVRHYYLQECEPNKSMIALMSKCANAVNATSNSQSTDNYVYCADNFMKVPINKFYLTENTLEIPIIFTRGYDLLKISLDVKQLDSTDRYLEDSIPILGMKLQGIPYTEEYWYPNVANISTPTELLIILPRSVLTPEFLTTQLLIHYLGGILEITPRSYLMGVVNDSAPIPSNGTVTICCKSTTINMDRGDLITKITVKLVDAHNNDHTHLISGFSINSSVLGKPIATVYNSKSTNNLMLQMVLPGNKLAKYTPVEIKVNTFSNISEDQLIKITYDYQMIEESNLQKSYAFGEGYAVLDGVINESMKPKLPHLSNLID